MMRYSGLHKFFILCFLFAGTLACEQAFEDRLDNQLREDQVYDTYGRIMDLGYNIYTYMPEGFNSIDDAYLAGASDEGEHSWDDSRIRLFNEGSWSKYDNPDDQWDKMYEGIRRANLFLENSGQLELFMVADTFTPTDKVNYEKNLANLGFMRAEARFLRAYFHFELIKRYGAVPIVTRTLGLDEGLDINRTSYEDCMQFVVSECDSTKDKVLTLFNFFDNTKEGRITTATVLALKSRAMLYSASPQNNPGNDPSKWLAAAAAANEFMTFNASLGYYQIHTDYGELFIPPNSYESKEVILSRRYGESNFVESANYPIGTDGGQSGTCPSHNLVDSYEKLAGWTPDQPYENRDPRLQMTVVVNNSDWNGRKIEIWSGGRDGKTGGIDRATKTGYYLKKFLVDNLELSKDQTARHAWIYFRYAEILLNYAEAVNEAYDFDVVPPGYPMSARAAIDLIRKRASMPPVVATNREELRDRIKHERRIELAFEGHRFWDARRWMEGEAILGSDLMGVDIERVNDSVFTYTEVLVENRVFKSHMNLYPISEQELIKYQGSMTQNPGW
ncbi:RagB/SusD family nutrient uptake outer membrane protein [Bacteroidota bacterium]